jgi:predicted DNA-binding ribbon-helix-helix protein
MPVKPTKRSFFYDGLNSSLCLEEPFWVALKEIAASSKKSVSDLVRLVDAMRTTVNRSSAIRVFVLQYYTSRITALAQSADELEHSSGGPAT